MPTKRSQEFMDLKHAGDKKASKPLIEKRRRARINHSLSQLKALIIDPKTTESSRQAKLEKADILEMTVQHLRDVKKQQTAVSALDIRHGKKKFEIGYVECIRQVELFLASLMDPMLTEIEADLKRRLKDHLHQSLQETAKVIENTQTNTCDIPSSHRQLSISSSSKVSFTASTDQTLSSPTNCDDSFLYKDDFVKHNTMLKNPYPNKLNHHAREPDKMEFGTALASKFENPHVSNNTNGNFDVTSRQIQGPTGAINSNYSSPPEQKVFQQGRFDPSPENLSINQSSARYSDSNISSNSYDLLNSEVTNSNDGSGYYASSHFNSTNSTNSGRNSSEQTDQKQRSFTVKSDRYDDSYHQISLIPRRLPNGEWALVLPGNLALAENESHSPLSAFRLVWPSGCSEAEQAQNGLRQQFVSSPLSSSVSEMSSEDYSYRMDADVPAKVEQDGHIEFGYVWRPW